ncbi:hypothetical protein PENTCL1PPCAC_6560, partial [Pristionchus entomophagus]
ENTLECVDELSQYATEKKALQIVTPDLFNINTKLFGNITKKIKGDLKSKIRLEMPNYEKMNSTPLRFPDDIEVKMESPCSINSSPTKKTKEGLKEKKKCELCFCPFLRVARTFDGEGTIVECMRRSCLATVEENVSLPIGFMYNVADDNRGWFSLDLNRTFYPKQSFDANYHFSNRKNMRCELDKEGHLLLPCPGQESLVTLI